MKAMFYIALSLAAMFLAAPAQSSVQRFAVFVGSDRGLRDEVPLKYADRDARQMAEVMGNSGTFSKDGIYLLPNPSLSEVRAVLQEVRARVKQAAKSGNESMVMVYMSGHGQNGAVHISGQRLTLEEIHDYFGSLESGLKILIVDACESGDLLRQKGGKVLETHRIDADDRLEAHGTVVLSSSAQGEEAQESEKYQGSVFTHHLINGLEGMADYNGDKEVSLWEMFYYARASTQAEKILGQQGQQNPSFDFDLVGRSDIPIAYLQKSRSRLVLRGVPSVPLEIYSAGRMELKNRLWLTGRQEVVLQLPSNDYILAFDDGDQVRLAEADLSHSAEKVMTPKAFQSKPRSLVYSKGGRAISDQGFQASMNGNNPAGDGLSMFGGLDYVYRAGQYKQIAGIGFGTGSMNNSDALIQRTYYSAACGLERTLFRKIRWQMLAGPQFKYFFIQQQMHDKRLAAQSVVAKEINQPIDVSSNSQIFQLSLPVDFETEVGGAFPAWLSLSVSPVNFVSYRDVDLNWQSRVRFQPVLSLSIGRHLGF